MERSGRAIPPTGLPAGVSCARMTAPTDAAVLSCRWSQPCTAAGFSRATVDRSLITRVCESSSILRRCMQAAECRRSSQVDEHRWGWTRLWRRHRSISIAPTCTMAFAPSRPSPTSPSYVSLGPRTLQMQTRAHMIDASLKQRGWSSPHPGSSSL